MDRFKNILLVVNGDTHKDVGMARAIRVARANGARLTVASVLPSPEEGLPDSASRTVTRIRRDIRDDRTALLEVLEKEGADAGVDVEARLLVGREFVAIIQDVLKHERDLVIRMGDGLRRGLKVRLFGSTEEHLLRKCPCPVWLLRPRQPWGIRSVLAAVDVSGSSTPGLNSTIVELASSLAQREKAGLHVVHAWSVYGENILRNPLRGIPLEDLDAILRETRQSREESLRELVARASVPGVEANLHLLKGEAQLVIRSAAEKTRADVLVMGTLSRVGIPGLFMGNTAESVLSQVGCSVLTVKPEGFHSPVELE
jgi:universal stress protein E